MTAEEQCALFIIDLDNFKQVNDTLGHQAGDQAIRQSARILSGLFRANDIVGRLGGDEFTVFLCGDITEEYVRKKAAQICDELHLALGDSQMVDITASVGVYLSARGQEFEGLYQAADLALYKAKKTGKHRYCLKDQDGYQEGQRGEFRPVSTIPLSWAAGVPGQRRGPAGDGAAAAGDLCQPQLLPHHRRGAGGTCRCRWRWRSSSIRTTWPRWRRRCAPGCARTGPWSTRTASPPRRPGNGPGGTSAPRTWTMRAPTP